MKDLSVVVDRNRFHLQSEMEAWCWQYIGAGGWTTFSGIPPDQSWSMESYFGRTTFWFRRPQDRTLFLLRWG